MTSLNDYTEGFKLKYDQFVHACDAAEAEGLWDTREYGEMEGYCFSVLMGVILHVINVDGSVSAREAESLNRNFGFDYTVEDLVGLFYSVGEEVEGNYLENAKAGIALLRKLPGGIADDFIELLGLICNIAAASDEGVSEKELEELRRLNAEL